MTDLPLQPTSPIIYNLLARGHEFSFDQVMRLARLHLGVGGAGELAEVPWQERVRVRPELSLSFPAADVARVERSGLNGADLLVTTTFLGLYGSSSPLPTHYTEDLLDEAAADSSVSRDFLDILHQRLYQLYFQCDNKYRLFVRIAEEQNPRDRERLFCLIGLGEKVLRDSLPDAWSLVRYAGLFSQFPRSAAGLQTLLRDALGVRKLEVEQCVLRRVQIPADQRMSLGLSGMSLGTTTVLGSEMPDRMGKFRIHIGPLDKKEYDSLQPGTPRHDKLAGLIRLYILDPFDFDLKLILAAKQAGPIRLGDPDGQRLGWNSWCFSGDTLGEVSALFPVARSAPPAPAADDFGFTPEHTEPSTLIDYYQQELATLRDLAATYATNHPELSPMISGHLADPGVERLFEGVAFLNANLRQKLDDDFPEVIHDVIDAIQPNYLRPIPATTIIVFLPKQNCTTTQLIPVGTELKSVPVDGTACTFTTRYPVEIHPLAITDVTFAQPSGKPAAITLSLKLTGIALTNWNLKSLRFFLAGESAHAADIYLVLMRYVKRIVIAPVKEGQSLTLDATHLKTVGFEETEALFPGSVPGAASHQLMHDYFIQPDKFMFVDLLGWEQWKERGEGDEFEIRFELDKLPFMLHQVSKADFALFAAPAVNVFKHRAEPIFVETTETNYSVIPAGGNPNHYQVYSVQNVSGLLNKTAQKIEIASGKRNQYSSIAPIYQISRKSSHIHQGLDMFISVKAPLKIDLRQMTLNVGLLCSNGKLPDKLQTGDICKETDNSPNFAEFTNCKPVRRSEYINMGNNTLWRLYSFFNLNIALLNARGLRVMLKAVSQTYNSDYATSKLYETRIQGIMDFLIKPTDRLFGRSMLRGWEIRIKLNREAFGSFGSMFLFGEMLDHFLRGFTTESCFTKTIVESAQGGMSYEWPAKMGRRPLL